VIVVGGLGPIGLAAVGAGDPVGEGVGPHVPLQQRAQREPAPTQFTLKQTKHTFQRCGAGIRCLLDPWIRDQGWVKNRIRIWDEQ